MNNRRSIWILMLVILSACGTGREGRDARLPKREVPILLNIKAQNNASINFINTDYFALQLVQDLDQFQSVNFVPVGPEESPEVILNLDITSFTLWPRDQRVSRRTFSRRVVAGNDAAGKPIYQTVSATVDIVQIQRRSNARMVADLTVKGKPGLKFQRSFVPSYNYINAYAENVRGDMRALDPGIMSGNMGIEPEEIDFLLILSRQEMSRRLSSELRRYYDAQKDTTSIK